MRVEAGLDRLLLAVPGPLAPGRNRQHPPAPHRPMGLTRPGRSRRAGPVPGGCGSRCASPRRADVRPAASQSVCVVPSSQPRRRHPRPAGRRTSGAAAPPSDAASHPRRAPRRRLRSKEEKKKGARYREDLEQAFVRRDTTNALGHAHKFAMTQGRLTESPLPLWERDRVRGLARQREETSFSAET